MKLFQSIQHTELKLREKLIGENSKHMTISFRLHAHFPRKINLIRSEKTDLISLKQRYGICAPST